MGFDTIEINLVLCKYWKYLQSSNIFQNMDPGTTSSGEGGGGEMAEVSVGGLGYNTSLDNETSDLWVL